MTNEQTARRDVIRAIADCIRAAGFEGLAEQYELEPACRGRILASPMLRLMLVRTIGRSGTANLLALAAQR